MNARSTLHLVLAMGGLTALALATTACDTQAFCFDDCAGTGSTDNGAGGAGGAATSSGVTLTGAGGEQAITVNVSSGAGGGCEVTNPQELCDGIDNDCNGEIDDAIDFADPRQCGNCATNCYELLLNTNPDTITCEASDLPGTDPGTCDGECATDYYDRDGDGTCEAFCVKAGNDDATCDNKDDDCDASIDEDVDTCTDAENCGICGRQCEAPNAVTDCEAEAGAAVCDESNTACVVTGCEPGFVDVNGLFLDGCELPCVETNGGVEICGDQIDNDCDGAIDGVDSDLSGDPFFGETCFGGQLAGGPLPQGVCAAAGNEGTWTCSAGGYACVGPNVVEPGELTESCNGDDDDCDGLVDNNAVDVGDSCGTSNNAPCRRGTVQCVGGAPACIGAIEPGVEVCNGRDDDCDTMIDFVQATGMPPADSIGACNVPVPPPAMATSACEAGTLTCLAGGVISCEGDTGPQAAQDTCGVDQNCDGALTNQPNTQTDVLNCGTCGTSCFVGAPANTIRACVGGGCVTQGCQPGFSDGPLAGPCDYACTPTGPEVCNNQDDDCDGMVDEGVVAPPPTQICGVSPAATSAACTSQVSVACTNGAFVCNFQNAAVCPGGCSADDEVCDAVDNDCDGFVNETTPNFGQACASDAGDPAPGDGACRQFGTFVCTSPTTTACNAMPAACNTLPGGCTEVCDGVDNDCDGSVDEPYTAKGDNAAFFYRPHVVRLTSAAPHRWMASYEATRPDASATTAGTGNGFVTSAPAGETLDATVACSEPDRVPWFNVTPREVEQTCLMMGGHICEYGAQWRSGCRVTPRDPDCTLGYAPSLPNSTACTTAYSGTKFCNIAPAFDFSPGAGFPGDQDGLLPTGDLTTENCFADWQGTGGNAVDFRLFDITGNLREIVLDTAPTPDVFRVVGGAFNTQAESGATCDFSFYSVGNAAGANRNDTFKFFDTGFRCCFDADPRL